MDEIVPEFATDDHEDLLSTTAALPRGSIILLLGDVDTGKSTLARRLADAVPRSVLLDTDVGQGTLAPPAAIGAALLEAGKPPSTIGRWFVGAVSPVRHIRELCEGAVRLLAVGRRRNPDLVVVDTCGLVRGRIGIAFKTRLVRALRPDLVVAVARSRELDPIIESIPVFSMSPADKVSPKIGVLRVRPGVDVRRKTPVYRRRMRAERLAAALDGARPLTFDVAIDSPDVPLSELAGLLVGLIDSRGLCLGIGAIVDIAVDRGTMTVNATVDPGLVRELRFGDIRVDGVSVATLPRIGIFVR